MMRNTTSTATLRTDTHTTTFDGLTMRDSGGRRDNKNKRKHMNIVTILAELQGNIHVGLAALGAAIGVGLIGMGASSAVGRNPGAATPILVQAILSTAFAEGIVFFALYLLPH